MNPWIHGSAAGAAAGPAAGPAAGAAASAGTLLNPCEDSKNPARKPRGPARSSGALGRAFSLKVASFVLTKKFSEAPEALRVRFFARLGHFGAQICSPEVPRDAPTLDFRV